MKILVIDSEGFCLDFAWRCKLNKHDVKYHIAMNPKKGIISTYGDGIVSKVNEYKPYMDWADLIVLCDNIILMEEMKNYRNKGYPIFGIDDDISKCELDRNYGQDLFKKYGIETMPYEGPFNDYDSGINFVKKNLDKRWVSKPCGEETDKSLSYVSKSAEDMIFMLQKWKEKGKKQSFILQEFKPGIEMAVGGFYGPGGFSKYYLENFEFKKYLNGDLGVNTGEQGTVIGYVQKSKLAEELLTPLIPYLKSKNYCGYIDVACIIDEKTGTPYPLEFTSRFGYPLWQIQQALHIGDPAEWMLDLIKGKDTLKVKDNKVCIGVVLSNGSYPKKADDYYEEQDYPIKLDKVNMNDIHPSEVKIGKTLKISDGKIKEVDGWVTAGNYILTATACGDTVSEAKEKVYKILKNIEVGNSPQYRTDIGDRLNKQLPTIQKFGYAKMFKFDEKSKGSEVAEQYAQAISRKIKFY
jgi:phosphoribosylamine--glycine ligase